jgi:2-polyprenyl-3-methyl-5-hydroxy-6-metoxy-1,4-benzoquinol methylase
MLVKNHWDSIYKTKNTDQLSWTQDVPQVSLDFINSFKISKNSRIIDVGGGESNLVDFLLDMGYRDITVLDISEESINRAKNRLGHKASMVKWIVQDITEFETDQPFDCWHDRAAFHFLTESDQVSKYSGLAKKYIKPNGYLIVGTFSENGPEKCSGLKIKRYSQDAMSLVFSDGFKKIECLTQDHQTPFKTSQNFIYCSFQRI